ncbi:MAG TPA: hypothetical protein VHO03_14735 [Ignavibacteriales bacterium]|nr:hypothetical protein [Ignavibacteriales bacterium]
MKIAAFIFILLSSLASAGVNKVTSAADSLSSYNSSSGLKPSYSLGVILGDNVGLRPKFIVSNIYNKYELQGYGMYYSKYHFDFGLDLNYIVFKNENFSHSVGIGGGMEKGKKAGENDFGVFENLSSTFVKINYSFMWKFVFLQLGAAIGSGDYSALRFKSQLGVMYNF